MVGSVRVTATHTRSLAVFDILVVKSGQSPLIPSRHSWESGGEGYATSLLFASTITARILNACD
jgi:hypothetical protein